MRDSHLIIYLDLIAWSPLFLHIVPGFLGISEINISSQNRLCDNYKLERDFFLARTLFFPNRSESSWEKKPFKHEKSCCGGNRSSENWVQKLKCCISRIWVYSDIISTCQSFHWIEKSVICYADSKAWYINMTLRSKLGKGKIIFDQQVNRERKEKLRPIPGVVG